MKLSDERLIELAQTYRTPLYVFQESIIRSRCKQLKDAITYESCKIRYACKALTLQAVLRIMLDEGFWIDASSVNEVHRALRAGFNPEEIYYTGEGATAAVYKFLCDRGILINCTSIDQLHLLGTNKRGHQCSIRVNPGRGHGESNKTNTGGPGSKHGIYLDQIDEARSVAKYYGLKIIGIHSHIGSGAKTEEWKKWNEINETTLAIARDFSTDLEFVNLGGGLPVSYRPSEKPMDIIQWGREVSRSMRRLADDIGRNVTLFIEPGRFLVAECGLLLAEVQSIKTTPADDECSGYRYIIVNTGLNHNIRPAMYGSHHEIRFVSCSSTPKSTQLQYVVAGYLCESGDVFTVGKDGRLLPREFPEVRVGDLMVMENVGAYSHAMKSEYNSMNLPASVLIDNLGRARVIERRGTLDDIMRREVEAYDEGRDIGM